MKIRLVGENVVPGIYEFYDAKQIANSMQLDLVKISESKDMDIYKIMDEKKFLFDKKKKESDLKKNQKKIILKEIELTPNIAENDFNTKLNQARKFYEKGFPIKLRVFFSGRTIMYKEIGEEKLYRFIDNLKDIYTPESIPNFEGKKMYCIIKPKKK